MNAGLLSVLLLLAPLFGAWSVGLIFVGTLLYTAALLAPHGGGTQLWICCAVLSWPLSFCLLTALLQRYLRISTALTLAAFLGSGYAVLESGVFADVIALAAHGGMSPVFAILKLLGQVLFGGSLAAGCLMLAELTFEVPVAWLSRASHERFWLPLAGLRIVLILLLFSLSLQFIVDLFQAEIVPG